MFYLKVSLSDRPDIYDDMNVAIFVTKKIEMQER
jgi:hypothetical protein